MTEPTTPAGTLIVLPLAGLPEVRPGDDIGALVATRWPRPPAPFRSAPTT